jgi:penicillin amidase
MISNHRSRPRIRRRLALALAAPALLCGCALSAYLGYRSDPDYPRAEEKADIDIPGLAAPVDVLFDPQGVPHVRAQSEADLLRAAGYLMARERFFEMDLLRRIARGRLSELVGEQPLMGTTTVEFDRLMRGWGIEAGAEQDARDVDGEIRELLLAFAAGVNAGMERHRPIEHRLIGVPCEPWTVLDTFAVGRLTAWSVTHNWSQEISRLILASYLGPDRAEALYPSRPWPGGVSLALDAPAHPLPPGIVGEVRELLPKAPVAPNPPAAARAALWPSPALFALGSNAWAAGGGRTRSGKPMLASDPHLTHMLPSMMMQIHLQCPEWEAIGITVPGLPYVLIGHNNRVAWGMTSAVADVVDFYLEKPDPNDPSRVLAPEGFVLLAEQAIQIGVREGGEVKARSFRLRRSQNGPLVQDLYPDALPPWAPPVALHMDPGSMADSLRRIRQSQSARSVAELHDVLSGVAAPASVYLAVDTDGGLALFTSGRIPVRSGFLGTFPVPGWLAKYRWAGFVPASDLPHRLADAGETLAHGNGLVWDPARAPFPFHIDSAPSYRFDRIVQLLQATPRHDAASFARIHRDVHALRAERVLPFILEDLERMSERSELEDRALEKLVAWDREATPDSIGATVFFETYRQAGRLALEDEIPEAARKFVLEQRYSTHMTDLWFEEPRHPVWDDLRTESAEDRAEIVKRAFRLALAELRRQLGPNIETWSFGRLHRLDLRHALGGKAILAELFNLPPHPMPGALDTVWKAHFDVGNPREPYRVMAGPVFRMIADAADLSRARWILDTGASGWPGSPHYLDQHPLWLRGEYVPMLADWKALERRARGRLTLLPEGKAK